MAHAYALVAFAATALGTHYELGQCNCGPHLARAWRSEKQVGVREPAIRVRTSEKIAHGWLVIEDSQSLGYCHGSGGPSS